jgi:hypothetical protein
MNDCNGFLKGRLYQVLFEHGPKTYEELCVLLPGLTAVAIRRSINHDKRRHAPERNTFRITAYHRNIGRKADMSPIIGLGPGEDAPKPVVASAKEASRRRTERVSIARAHRDDPRRAAEELACLQYRHLQEANTADRPERVFASMFAPPPAPPTPTHIPRRIYKTPRR